MTEKRIKLKQFRIGLQLTQQEMAKKLNVSTITYITIENGTRNGKPEFWNALQNVFNVPDEDMWGLQKKQAGVKK